MVQVNVHAGNSELAIRNLKRKMQRELKFRSLRDSREFEPPSLKRLRKREESKRRIRKLNRRRHLDD